jgi:hypothetical protein
MGNPPQAERKSEPQNVEQSNGEVRSKETHCSVRTLIEALYF